MFDNCSLQRIEQIWDAYVAKLQTPETRTERRMETLERVKRAHARILRRTKGLPPLPTHRARKAKQKGQPKGKNIVPLLIPKKKQFPFKVTSPSKPKEKWVIPPAPPHRLPNKKAPDSREIWQLDNRPFVDVDPMKSPTLKRAIDIIGKGMTLWTNGADLDWLCEYKWELPHFKKSHEEAQEITARTEPSLDSDWSCRDDNANNNNMYWNKWNNTITCAVHCHPAIQRIDKETAGIAYKGDWGPMMVSALLERISYCLDWLIFMDQFNYRWQNKLPHNRWKLETWSHIFQSNYWMLCQRHSKLTAMAEERGFPALRYIYGMSAYKWDHEWHRLTIKSEYWREIEEDHRDWIAKGKDPAKDYRWKILFPIFDKKLWETPEHRYECLYYVLPLQTHGQRHYHIPGWKQWRRMRDDMRAKGAPANINWNSK
ncbi:MAG: hypothetical protein GY940_20415, partial [bacterium]|nr:hypothetical protein [bacterium]